MNIMLPVARSAPKMMMANRPRPKRKAKATLPKPSKFFSTACATAPAKAVPMSRYTPQDGAHDKARRRLVKQSGFLRDRGGHGLTERHADNP